MNDLRVGRVAVSRSGHDRGRAFLVVGVDGTDYLLLADGKTRLLAKPKKKKRMHVFATPSFSEELSRRIESGEKLLDSDIRKALKALGYSKQEEEGYIVKAGRN